jgi:hypothetical protein
VCWSVRATDNPAHTVVIWNYKNGPNYNNGEGRVEDIDYFSVYYTDADFWQRVHAAIVPPVVHARPAEVVEVVEVKPTGEIEIPYHKDYHKNKERTGNGEYPPCIVCGRGIKASDPAMVHVHHGGTHLVTEERAAQLNPAADMYLFPIGPDCLKRHPELKPFVIPALPSAPLAPETHIPSLASDTSGAGQAGAVEAASPPASDLITLRNAIIDYLDCPTCHGGGVHWTDIDGEAEPDSCDRRNVLDELIALAPTVNPAAATAAPDILRRRALALLDAWKECGVETEMDVALAQLDRALNPAAPEPCRLCGGNHRATACPDVAAEWRRQEQEGPLGWSLWQSYRERRETLVDILRDSESARRAELAGVLARYLSTHTGTILSPALVLNEFERLIRNAA